MSTTPRHLEKYELQQQLGRGSIGEVWKGYDTQLRRDVAIKIIHNDLQSDSNFLTRFTAEGQVIAALHHSNIVQIREVEVSRSSQSNTTTAYVVMDYIEGGTFNNYLRVTSHKGAFPSIPQIMYLFTSLGLAIDYAHQKGLVHGNIKPDNILLNARNTTQFAAGEPMLTDFGFTRFLNSSESIASPFYMSPEQAKGQEPNNRSDIYSLGVLLYEICTGVQPFRDESSVAVMMQHINTLPTPPILINPNIPPALSEVILRAMAKDTATRFSMASLLAAAIADACSMHPSLHTSKEDLTFYKSANAQASLLGVAQPPANPMFYPQNTSPRLSAFSPTPISPPASQPLPQNSASMPVISKNQFSDNSTLALPKETIKLPTPLPPTQMQTTSSSIKTPISLPPISSMSPIPSGPHNPPIVTSFPPDQPSVHMPAILPATRTRTRITDAPVYVVIVALLLLLVVIGSAIGTSFLLTSRGQTTTTPSPVAPSGRIYFQDDALGRNDALRIQMKNLPAPSQGKTYYAWLQTNTQQTLQLGPLTVQNGSASLLYPGNAQHTNLLSTTQNIFITQENAAVNPATPSNDRVYQAIFDTPSFMYVQNILTTTPGLPGKQSVIVGLFEQIKSINDKAGSITDSLQNTHDTGLARRQAIRIIEIIDSTKFARSSGDLPAREPSLTPTQVGLLSSPAQKGLIDILAAQLAQVKENANNDSSLLQHSQNVQNAITDLKDWVQKMRTDAVYILKAADLTDPAIIGVALQLKKAAADSYTGRTIPPNDGPQPILGSAGAYQAYIECQYMASIELKKV